MKVKEKKILLNIMPKRNIKLKQSWGLSIYPLLLCEQSSTLPNCIQRQAARIGHLCPRYSKCQ